MNNWFLVIIGLLAILAELFVGVDTGFDLVLLGSTLVAGGVVGNLTNNWQIGLVLAIILSVAYVVLGRKYIRSRLTIKTNKTNIDVLVGDTGVVTSEIKNDSAGQVRVGTELWRAVSEANFEIGERVKIISVDGVTLKVIQSN